MSHEEAGATRCESAARPGAGSNPRSRKAEGQLDDADGQMTLRRFLQGDQTALDDLIRAYSPMLFSVFFGRYRLSAEDAEEMFQETFLQLITKADQVRNVRSWLLGTAFNLSRSRVRSLIRDRRLAENFAEQVVPVQQPENEDDSKGLVQRAFTQLSTSDQRLLSALFLQELSYEEAAALLDRPIGSIGPSRGRALKKLRRTVAMLEALPPPMIAGA